MFVGLVGEPVQDPEAPDISSMSIYIGECMSAGVGACATCCPSKYQVIVLASQSTA